MLPDLRVVLFWGSTGNKSNFFIDENQLYVFLKTMTAIQSVSHIGPTPFCQMPQLTLWVKNLSLSLAFLYILCSPQLPERRLQQDGGQPLLQG